MAIRISTALRNFMLGQGSFKDAFSDSIIKLYSGSPPATADLGVTGTHLLTVTRGSATVTSGDLSVPQMVTATATGSSGTWALTINDVLYSQALSNTLTETIRKLADKINRTCPEFKATSNAGLIMLAPRNQGNSGKSAHYVVNGTGTTGGDAAMTSINDDIHTFTRSNALSFGTVTSGYIIKPDAADAVWSGAGETAAGTGTSAGYFRLMRSDDDGSADSGYIYERVQGTVGTSGADLILSSVNIVSGATTTIDGFKFTLPETV